ncbi:MAG: hypothetical protein U1F66_04210 [bacterium]
MNLDWEINFGGSMIEEQEISNRKLSGQSSSARSGSGGAAVSAKDAQKKIRADEGSHLIHSDPGAHLIFFFGSGNFFSFPAASSTHALR